MTQIRLRSDARTARMKIAREVLDPYGGEGTSEPQTDPFQEIIIRAFAAAQRPTELAVIDVHEQLAPLTNQLCSPGSGEGFPLGSVQCDLRLQPGDTEHGSGSSSCANPNRAGDLGSPARHPGRSSPASPSGWTSSSAGATRGG